MHNITAQVSLYTLGQQKLTPAISAAVRILRARGLDVEVSTMSSLVAGDAKAVFPALESAYSHLAAQGPVVMVVTFSNACPAADASRANYA